MHVHSTQEMSSHFITKMYSATHGLREHPTSCPTTRYHNAHLGVKLLKIEVTRLVRVPFVKANGVLSQPLRQCLEFTGPMPVTVGGGIKG